MKNEKKSFDLLIALGIVFGIYVILSYIIPVGYYNSSTFSSGETDPVGLVGIFKAPLYSVAIFVQYLVVFLSIGGLYAVMSKTGVYSKVIDSIVKKFSKKKTLFLIISIISFALLASLSGLPIVVFALVPFVSAIILLLGYDKVTALASTVGAILVGIMGSTYGNALVFKSFFGLDANKGIVYKFGLLAVLVFLLIMFVIGKNKSLTKKEEIKETKKSKKTKKEEVIVEPVIEAPFYIKGSKEKKSSLPLIIIFIVLMVVSFVGMYNWYYSFGIELFNKISTSISEFKIGGIAIFSKLLGTFTEIGQWGNYEFAALILFATVIIAWVYSIKPSEAIETYFEGIKSMLKTSIYVALACVIFAIMVNSSNGTLSATISNFILGLSKSFNVLLVSLTGMVGGFFFNDFPYLVNSMYGGLIAFEKSALPAISIILQSAYGFVMFILPVSVVLVAGLKFLDVSYKDWMKYIWKLLLQLFVVVILFGLIISMII